METIESLVFSINTFWVLFSAILVFFMQAGFGMLEAGFTRAKNAINILMKNLVDFSLGIIGFFCIGYAFMFGTGNDFIGLDTFFLSGIESIDVGVSPFAFFFFQAAFAATAATLVAGAVAERAQFFGYAILSLIITTIIYPISGHWVWGGGFLSEIGFSDFAGSTVVHSVGGWIALVAAIIIGPRLGRFEKTKDPECFAGHNIPLATLGFFILWFGWFGFNAGSNLAIAGEGATELVSLIVLNTVFAAVSAAVVSMIVVWITTGKANAGVVLNGTLGGLVAITAGCDAVSPISALLIGAIGGITVYLATLAIEKYKIDDAVGAFPVHGAAGMVGTILLGLFSTSAGWLVAPDANSEFFLTQITGVVVVSGWAIITSAITLLALKHTIGLRVTAKQEKIGLDESKHGIKAYPQFEE